MRIVAADCARPPDPMCCDRKRVAAVALIDVAVASGWTTGRDLNGGSCK